jgi:hypothetical protein
MRCPKCGYISFDHLETCPKCKKSIESPSESFHGSVYNVAAPAFLKFDKSAARDEIEISDAFSDSDDAFFDDEIRDPDLDILIEEEDEDEDREIQFGFNEEPELTEPDLVPEKAEEDEEEGGISFNLDQFRDEDEDNEIGGLGDLDDDEAPAGKSLSIELPEELTDISDLEPPVLEEVTEVGLGDDDFDLDIDFDLELDEKPKALPDADEEFLSDTLSLDDIEPKAKPEKIKPKKKPTSADMDMDNDLNFDLDLGELNLEDDDEIKKR